MAKARTPAKSQNMQRENEALPPINFVDLFNRRTLGIIGLIVCVILLISLISYDPGDFGTQNPPNDPIRNSMGIMGAVLTFRCYGFAGLVHHYLTIPFLAIISIFLIHGKIKYSRLRVFSLLAIYIIVAAILDTFETFQKVVELRYGTGNGGHLGQFITSNFLDYYIGAIGSCMFLWSSLIFFIMLFFGFRESILCLMRLCAFFSAVTTTDTTNKAATSDDVTDTQSSKDPLETLPDNAPSAKEPQIDVAPKKPGFLARLFKRKAPPSPTRDIRDDLRDAYQASTPTQDPSTTVTPSSLQQTAALFAQGMQQVATTKPRLRPKPIEPTPTPAPAPAPIAPPPVVAEPLVLTDDTQQPLKPISQEGSVTAPTPALHDNNVDDAVEYEDYGLPSASLLDPIPPAKRGANNVQESIAAIENVFAQFNLDAKVVNYIQGPVLTQFEIAPKDGVKLDKYRSYESNLLMALRAHSIRIQAPIPGTGFVGIEVPNAVRQSVTLREVLESEAWHQAERKMALPLILGKKATGGDLIVDLAELPHLLVAGGTGSGKSVSVNGMLIGLLMCRKPEQLRLIMVDPKRVEFTAYDDLPHLLNPVVVEPKKVLFCLRWAVVEMNRRYKELQKYGARNIGDYNARVSTPKPGVRNPSTTLPYIVIIIDELADLMLTVKADIEPAITSLTQKARAAGIHLIIATQRPTTDIITGTIKANIPGRVALRVSQSNDSRTIIDATGAENLIGKGDMLFSLPGSVTRSQAPWVSDNEIQRVCTFIRDQVGPAFDNFLSSTIDKIREEKPADDMNAIVSEFIPEPEPATPAMGMGTAALGEPEGDDDESLYKQALELIRQTGRFSASNLQRRLRIGYNRASRIADLLEERGIIGPSGKAGSTREILVDLNAIAANDIYKGTDAESAIFDTRTNPETPPASQGDAATPSSPIDSTPPIAEDDFDLEAFDEQLRASIDALQPGSNQSL